MNAVQLFALMQNQVLEIRTGMKLTRHVVKFRAMFKTMVGLPRNASNVAVLQEVGRVHQENLMADEFNEYMIKYNMVEEHGIQLV
jgi:hypothetical protein